MDKKQKALKYFKNAIDRNKESILLAENIGNHSISKRCREENEIYQIAVESLSLSLKSCEG